ncbi:MAG: hypothetical protein IJM64_02390 [Ottowia sp.]|nr:hypothetical protein [Ottowia sp.]
MNTDPKTLSFADIEKMDADSYFRFVEERLDEAYGDDRPGIPHEQVMAKAWAYVESLVEKRA